MKLYVIRHGLTNCNVEKKYNGKLDEDINETGILQAKKAQEIIRNLNIDLIICSPLLRTRHTCNIINVNDVPVIFDNRIEEEGVRDNIEEDNLLKYDEMDGINAIDYSKHEDSKILQEKYVEESYKIIRNSVLTAQSKVYTAVNSAMVQAY